jgi:hypothetical protein
MNERLTRRGPEYRVAIEYTASCDSCGFTISDITQDANEKDAMTNVVAISEGTHSAEHRVRGTTCDRKLTLLTKTTYFK